MKNRKLLRCAAAAVLALCVLAGCSPRDPGPTGSSGGPSDGPTGAPHPDYSSSRVLRLSFEGTAEDASGCGNHGTLNKDGVFADGVSGQALCFDGKTYVDLGTSGSLQPEKLTFSAWIRADGPLTGENMIAWFKPDGNYQGEGWYLSCLDDNTPLKLSVGKAAGQPMECFVSGSRAAFFPAGEWVHIAVTYDSAAHICGIYRNGIAQSVSVINDVKEIHADETSRKYLGFNSPKYNGGFAKMTMDELEIYEQILPTEEIIRLYTQFGAKFDGSQIVEKDWESLSLPLQWVKDDILLPTVGVSGSAISWRSSNEGVLSASGAVVRPAAGEADAEVTLTALLSYAGYQKEKAFHVRVEALPRFADWQDFPMGDVELLDDYEENAFHLETAYLKELDADRLLKGFCTVGGVASDAELYGGWENSAIRGHTLGHYLTAVSQAYAASGDPELLAIVNHVVAVLAQCQNSETGYLAAIPESHYIQLEKGNTAGTWVPWYTMHKVLAGLISAYEQTGNRQALTVASRLGDWVWSRTSTWSEAVQKTVLNVEYGGMNDCLYQLYSHTGSEKHLAAAHSFDEAALFDALYNGEDILNGKHANTTIPKIIGALNRYQVLGENEAYYLRVAENFWEIVVRHHSYITGGNSEWEHFGQPDVLDAEKTNCNCETCNTYNMLKLSRELFKITGSAKYTDFYENTFINAILSSQNPETGMTTYFQPMDTGYFKVYSSKTGHFWCCTGSGMENFSKLGDSVYYHAGNALYVSRFTSSCLTWEEKGLTLTQTTDLPLTDTVYFTVHTADGKQADMKLVLRVPDWCAGAPAVQVNGKTRTGSAVNGLLVLDGPWNDGDEITYTLPMELRVFGLPDNPNTVAFKYGPLVLSANMGNEDMFTGTTGVNVTIPGRDSDISDVIKVARGSREDWLRDLAKNLVRTPGNLEFILKGTDRDGLVFTPHYMQYENRYGIYFDLVDENTAAGPDEDQGYVVIDSLPVANDQYEFSHNLQGDLTGTGMHKGLNYRHAEAGGFFSYDMAVEQGCVNLLKVKYFSGDVGRAFRILVDGKVLKDVVIENVDPDNFYDVYYEIPEELTAGKTTVTITFEANQNSFAGGIFEKLSIVKRAD